MAIHTDASAARQCAVTASSTAFAIQSAASVNKIVAYNAGAVLVHYLAGDSGVSASAYSANVGDAFIPPNTVKEIWVGDSTHIALVTDSGTATVHIESFEEMQR